MCAVSKGPDMGHTQANTQAASSRAGAYLSSWGAWASEKKKGWSNRSASTTPVSSPAANNTKRAEQFQKEKSELLGDSSQRWSDESIMIRDLDAEAAAEKEKRESLFFDAEKERNKEAEKEPGKEAETKAEASHG